MEKLPITSSASVVHLWRVLCCAAHPNPVPVLTDRVEACQRPAMPQVVPFPPNAPRTQIDRANPWGKLRRYAKYPRCHLRFSTSERTSAFRPAYPPVRGRETSSTQSTCRFCPAPRGSCECLRRYMDCC